MINDFWMLTGAAGTTDLFLFSCDENNWDGLPVDRRFPRQSRDKMSVVAFEPTSGMVGGAFCSNSAVELPYEQLVSIWNTARGKNCRRLANSVVVVSSIEKLVFF